MSSGELPGVSSPPMRPWLGGIPRSVAPVLDAITRTPVARRPAYAPLDRTEQARGSGTSGDWGADRDTCPGGSFFRRRRTSPSVEGGFELKSSSSGPRALRPNHGCLSRFEDPGPTSGEHHLLRAHVRGWPPDGCAGLGVAPISVPSTRISRTPRVDRVYGSAHAMPKSSCRYCEGYGDSPPPRRTLPQVRPTDGGGSCSGPRQLRIRNRVGRGLHQAVRYRSLRRDRRRPARRDGPTRQDSLHALPVPRLAMHGMQTR